MSGAPSRRELFDEVSSFNRKLRAAFDALVREHGMTLARARVFHRLSRRDGINQRELADEVSVAFLVVLERLGPEERAAFLLHEVFDYDYPEVAQMLGKSEPTCRQMIHRARARVRESRPRFSVTAESRERILTKFLAAAGSGDRKAVMALLAEDVEYMADGGGKVVAALKVLRGPERIGWLYHCIARRFTGLTYRLIRVNEELGAVVMMDGRLFSILSFVTDGQRVCGIYNVRNPDKLGGVALRDLAA